MTTTSPIRNSRKPAFAGIKRLPFSFVVAGLLFAAPAASAAALTAPLQAPRVPISQSTSSNWSGYAVETNLTSPQSGAVSDVKGQWVVPSLSCTNKNTYSAAWVGIDGYSSGTVEQTGTEQDCASGKPRYYAWYEMYPQASATLSGFLVKPGDTVSAEVQYTGGTSFALTLVDGSQKFTTTKSSNGLRQSAEWIMEAPSVGGHILPLTNFGTISFSGASATLNGSTGAISAFANDPMTMVDGTARATPSGLASGGSAFSVTYSSGGHGNGHH